MGETRNEYKDLVGKYEGKRTLEGPKRRLEDNSKMELRQIVWEGVYLFDLSSPRYGPVGHSVSRVINRWAP